MICTKITVKYLLRILTITTNKRINSILISRNANPQDGCGGIIIYHKLASVLHSRSCRYALDINTDLSSLSFADVPEITAMIIKSVVLHFYLLLFDSVGASFTPIQISQVYSYC